MRCAGIDIGSRTVKLVVLENGRLVYSHKSDTSYNPLDTACKITGSVDFDVITATGYGRYLLKGRFESPVISEITAFAKGAQFLLNDCVSILNIGGQDTKAIALDDYGNVKKFEMNNKCAAGTGRFPEVMATALGFTLEEFSQAALGAEKAVKINSMCTVFAESEVVSLLHKGPDTMRVDP